MPICPLIFLNWPTMRYHILMQKLSFLHRLLNSDQSTISVKVFNSLTNQAPGPLIIQQCKFLEEVYNSNITDSIMKGGATCLKYIKKALRVADSDYIWTKVSRQLSLRALSRDISWPKLWDMARDRGIQGARSIRVLLRVLAKPVFENSRCPFCDLELARESLFANHVATAHLSRSLQDLLAP